MTETEFGYGELVQYVGPREKYSGIGRVTNVSQGRGHFASHHGEHSSLKRWPGEFPSFGPHYYVTFRDGQSGWFRGSSLAPAPAIDQLAEVVRNDG